MGESNPYYGGDGVAQADFSGDAGGRYVYSSAGQVSDTKLSGDEGEGVAQAVAAATSIESDDPEDIFQFKFVRGERPGAAEGKRSGINPLFYGHTMRWGK